MHSLRCPDFIRSNCIPLQSRCELFIRRYFSSRLCQAFHALLRNYLITKTFFRSDKSSFENFKTKEVLYRIQNEHKKSFSQLGAKNLYIKTKMGLGKGGKVKGKEGWTSTTSWDSNEESIDLIVCCYRNFLLSQRLIVNV